ncbi:ATP-binding protein [Kitasatospora herbaricolor]|uniref:ATP-binding protein n=1 Tax=Kitasatospora herbaricolor TaxID=68217 RepID=UPI0036D94F0C
MPATAIAQSPITEPAITEPAITEPRAARPPTGRQRTALTASSGPACGADSWQARFTAAPDSVGGVRVAVRRYFDRVRPGRPQERDDLLLVVSELVTNAVRHAGGPGVVDLALLPDAVDIAVSDPSRTLPLPRLPDPCAGTGGLGLHLVAALCGPVQVTLDPGSGKTVHARLPCRRPTGPEVAAAPAARRRSW